MFDIAQYIVLELVVAFILGIILGYLIAKDKNKFKVINTKNETSSQRTKEFKINPVFNKNTNLDYKPLVLSSSNKKDNLKKIKGIDEKLEEELYKLGIFHYEQIASWTSKNIKWIEGFLNMQDYVKANQWVEQAKILKTGNETDYSKSLIENESSEDLASFEK